MRRRITPSMRAKARGLKPPPGAESRYVRELRGILRAASALFAKDVRAALEARGDSRVECTRRVDSVRSSRSLEKKLGVEVGRAFDRMAKAVNVKSKIGLEAFGVSNVGKNPELAKALAERRAENVDLVKNASAEVRTKMVAILEEASPGTRWEDIAGRIAERGLVSESRAELIARDQALSTAGEVIAIQQREAGITRYLWSTSQDDRVRDEHEEREALEFDWDDPPEDGHPGEAILCRCVAIPVIEEL